jgi:CheY-like chemotaxis protein
MMKRRVLNLREIAAEYEKSAGDYFGLLSDFINLAPDAINALAAFEKLDGNIKAYRNVDRMAALLKEIRCDRFITDFYSILGSYEQGNWRLAAFKAEQAIKPFDEFCKTILAARKTKAPANAPDTALSMNDFIKCLDGEEANRKMVICAVDDSPSILTSLTYVLNKEYKVFTLLKPAELEKALKSLTPDMFLLDYLMPGLNGFELVPIIRGFEEHKDTPIIYLTAIGTIDTVTSALAIGACDFIVKPFNPDILLQKIAKWIVRKKLF